jgi:hypothetical protein
MKFFLIFIQSNGCSIIARSMTLGEMQRALSWQKQGGFNPDAYIIAKPTGERGVFADVETGVRVTPHRGAYTESAFNHVIDTIWGKL